MQLKDIIKLFRKNLLIAELILVGFIIILGAFTFHFVEGWRILDSFYFIISTMSTIGLGDFLPQTDVGKGFFMFYAIIGVPFFISIGGLILENRFRKSIEHYLKKVYRDLRNAEAEIEAVEKNIVKKLNSNFRNVQEKKDNIKEKEDQSVSKKAWWRFWSKKNK